MPEDKVEYKITSHVISADKYKQGKGLINNIGREAAGYGKNVIIVADEGGFNACGKLAVQKLYDHNLNVSVGEFVSECSMQQIQNTVNYAAERKAEVLIGMGGGKCLDLAKAAGELSQLAVITIPTIAATCAACTPLTILYHNSGKPDRSFPLTKGVDLCLADTEILLKAPPYTLAAGIADSLAKHQEVMCGHPEMKSASTAAGVYGSYCIARAIDDILYNKGRKAYESCCLHEWSEAFEDVIYALLSLTAICSGLAAGAGQLALAHAFNDAIHEYYTAKALEHLHGEIVGVGTILQMVVNRSQGFESFRTLLSDLGLACDIRGLGIEQDEWNQEMIEEYLVNVMKDSGIDGVREKIYQGVCEVTNEMR